MTPKGPDITGQSVILDYFCSLLKFDLKQFYEVQHCRLFQNIQL